MKKYYFIVMFLFFLAGCQNGEKGKLLSEIEQLKIRNSSLAEEISQSQQQNIQLEKQVQALRNFGTPANYNDIYNLQKIAVTKYTNIYDNDGDGRKETLLVYFQPFDEFGDVIKASGLVEVQLWDLNLPADKALLGQWKVEPAALKRLWFATILSVNYRLSFDVSAIAAKFDHPLTVKVKFTDYLSGKTFEEQRVINPQ